MFKSLSVTSGNEWEFIDGNYVKAHQYITGVASQQEQAIGGGNTSKVHLAVDTYGLLGEFIISGGDVHHSKVANELSELLPQADFVIANKGYDSEAIINKVRVRNTGLVIPRKKS